MPDITEILLIGGHISTSGGVSLSPERAGVFGFRTFQIFSKNQMQWKSKPLDPLEVERFKKEVKNRSQHGIMIHASYLLNMGTSKGDLRSKVEAGLKEEIKRADLLGVEFLVIHPGSSFDSEPNVAIKNICENLNSAISSEQNCIILLENSAGQGNTIGRTFEELATLLDGVDMSEKVGICMDTCHAWAAGYDIKSSTGYEETMDQFNSVIGLDKLFGFHMNDSKSARGERLDRHEQIGKGRIGDEGFSNLVNDKRFRSRPMIFETPLGEEGYAEDLNHLRKVLREQ